MFYFIMCREFRAGMRLGRLGNFADWCMVWLLFQILLVSATHARVADFLGSYLTALVLQQTAFVLLVGPAILAGTVTDEKLRGTLAMLLVTPVQPWEIVLAKLLGRQLQVTFLLLLQFPMICFITGLADLSGKTAVVFLVETIAISMVIASLTMLVALYCRTTGGAVVCAYLILSLAILILLAVLVAVRPRSLQDMVWLGEYLILEQHQDPRFLEILTRALAWFMPGCVLVILVLITFAVQRLHSSFAQSRVVSIRQRPWTPPLVDNDPVLWREVHIEGLSIAGWFQSVPRWAAMLAILSVSLVWPMFWLRLGLTAIASSLLCSVFVFACMILTVSMRAAAGISSEREAATWEGILMTPLETVEILNQKVSGTWHATLPYFGVAVFAVGYNAFWAESFACVCFALAALLTTIAGAYAVAVLGTVNSARAHSTWQSIMATVGQGTLAIGAFLTLGSMLLAGIGLAVAAVMFIVVSAGSILLAPLFVLAPLLGIFLYVAVLWRFVAEVLRSWLLDVADWVDANERSLHRLFAKTAPKEASPRKKSR